MNWIDHANEEFERQGLFDKDDEDKRMLRLDALQLILMISDQGHFYGTAKTTLALVEKIVLSYFEKRRDEYLKDKK